MINVNSLSDFKEKSTGKDNYWLFIYKSSSENSVCAYDSLEDAGRKSENIDIFCADVNDTGDIHTEYDVTSVPTLLKFENDKFTGIYKGCNDVSYYTSLFTDSIYSASGSNDAPKQKSVRVYSTPSCSWCTRLKDYLKENKIKFRDIDVSKDEKAAADMVKRSGQQGVPQSIIGGQLIIGFDKAKIDNLLSL